MVHKFLAKWTVINAGNLDIWYFRVLRYFLNVLAFLPLSGNQTNKTRDTKNFPIYSCSFPEPGNGGNLIFQMVMFNRFAVVVFYLGFSLKWSWYLCRVITDYMSWLVLDKFMSCGLVVSYCVRFSFFSSLFQYMVQ